MLHNAMGGIWISEDQCYEGAQSKVIRVTRHLMGVSNFRKIKNTFASRSNGA